jgi:hypothetical protein
LYHPWKGKGYLLYLTSEDLEAAKTQCKTIAHNLKSEVEKLGMACKVKLGFVGYRDYISREDGGHETPGNSFVILYIAVI